MNECLTDTAKLISKSNTSKFRTMMDQTRQWAYDVGMTEQDMRDAVKQVRAEKKIDIPDPTIEQHS